MPKVRPQVVTLASMLMFVAVGLGVIGQIVNLVAQGQIRDNIRQLYIDAGLTASADTAANNYGSTAGVIFGLLIAAGIATLAFFNLKGNNVTRIITWVVAGLAIVAGICGLIAAASLSSLTGLSGVSTPFQAFAAATVFGAGKTYFWPTMLGVTSERFPRGGSLLLAVMGGAGNLAVAFILPIMGGWYDKYGAGAAFRYVGVLPVILTFIFRPYVIPSSSMKQLLGLWRPSAKWTSATAAVGHRICRWRSATRSFF